MSILSFSYVSWAADGSSGCGPGWYLFKKNSLVSSSLRATTNGLLLPVVTLGMTLGTSNCSKHSIVKQEKASLYYVTQNYYELMGQTTRGSGEYIDAFAKVLGCQAKASPLLGQKMKKRFQIIFKKQRASDETTLTEIYNTIFSDPQLSEMCINEIA